MRLSVWVIGLVLATGCTVDGLPYPITNPTEDAGAVVARDDVAQEILQDRPIAVDHPVIVDDNGSPDVQTPLGRDAAVCVHPPGRCRTTADCCSYLCDGEYCNTGNRGDRCTSNLDCEYQAPCMAGQCQCQPSGGRCRSDFECCSRRCDQLDTQLCV